MLIKETSGREEENRVIEGLKFAGSTKSSCFFLFSEENISQSIFLSFFMDVSHGDRHSLIRHVMRDERRRKMLGRKKSYVLVFAEMLTLMLKINYFLERESNSQRKRSKALQ
jgi:hypothetical protein